MANKRLAHAVECVWGGASLYVQDLSCWSAEIRRSDIEAASLMDFLQQMRMEYVEQLEQQVRAMRVERRSFDGPQHFVRSIQLCVFF